MGHKEEIECVDRSIWVTMFHTCHQAPGAEISLDAGDSQTAD